jgi:2-methylcitrate dehydratase PrpD
VTGTLAFKPYPCGTMTHPYIDCARKLASRGVRPDDITEIVCEVGEGTVHRLWEPLADKQRPPNGYGAKFSTPYCIAAGFVRGNVGLDSFTDGSVKDAAVLALARKIRYVIDDDNPYPREFTGHVRAVLGDGRVVEERQPHLRGGAHQPLTRQDIADKFVLCARHGGWAKVDEALALARGLYEGRLDLTPLRG